MTDTSQTIPEWTPGAGTFKLGSKVIWEGVRLTCTKEHFSGEAAIHPWDPGHGWAAEKAATLWTPDGKVETVKLRARMGLIKPSNPRLTKVIYYAIGGP